MRKVQVEESGGARDRGWGGGASMYFTSTRVIFPEKVEYRVRLR